VSVVRKDAVKGKRVCHIHGGKSNGAPKGSKNALKTGLYETISLETMSAEELAFTQNITNV